MKRIKEFNYFTENENILIRSIRNNDLLFYEHWNTVMSIHNLDWKVNPVIMDEVYTKKGFTFLNKKLYQILIIEFNEKVIGDITIQYDKDLLLKDKSTKKPYYIMNIELHEECSNNDINKIIKLCIDSLDKFKLRIGTLCVFKDKLKNIENNYIENGFVDIYWGYDYKRLSSLITPENIFQTQMLIRKM
jgi:hypothetical protein